MDRMVRIDDFIKKDFYARGATGHNERLIIAKLVEVLADSSGL